MDNYGWEEALMMIHYGKNEQSRPLVGSSAARMYLVGDTKARNIRTLPHKTDLRREVLRFQNQLQLKIKPWETEKRYSRMFPRTRSKMMGRMTTYTIHFPIRIQRNL
jgi:hypothetical protein